MGQSLFLENRGQRLVQVWLLTFCVLLCCRTGDAVKCRRCISRGAGQPCLPNAMTCEASFCMMVETFSVETGELVKGFKDCGPDHLKRACGTELSDETRTKTSCCDTDLCFD